MKEKIKGGLVQSHDGINTRQGMVWKGKINNKICGQEKKMAVHTRRFPCGTLPKET
jgi:hypothetical protein